MKRGGSVQYPDMEALRDRQDASAEAPRDAESRPGETSAPPLRPSAEEIYRRTFRYLWNLLHVLGVHAREEREDALHEIFLVVIERHETFDPRRSVEAWIGGIAWRVVAERRRRAAMIRKHVGTEAVDADALPDATPGPEQIIGDAQRRRIVLDLLESVPEDARIVLVMKELYELDMLDVAEALGIPPGTGWTRLRRAKEAFRNAAKRLSNRDRAALGAGAAGAFALAAMLSRSELEAPDAPDLDEIESAAWSRLLRAAPRAVRIGGAIGAAGLAGAKVAAVAAIAFLTGAGAGAGLYAWAKPHAALSTAEARDPAVSDARAPIAAATALPAPAPDPSVMAASAQAAPTEPPSAQPKSAAAPRASASSSSSSDARGERERALLERASAAIGGGRGAEALALAERHAETYPQSALGQEREVIAIQALALVGRREEARQRARRFRAAHPESPLAPAMDAALGTSP